MKIKTVWTLFLVLWGLIVFASISAYSTRCQPVILLLGCLALLSLMVNYLVVRLYIEAKGLMLIDETTGVLNKKGLHKRLSEAIKMALRYNHHLSLLIFDLDGFKKINDTYGHLGGDKYLKQTVDLIKESIREEGDIVARPLVGRFGGDEFVVILFGANEENANKVLERIRNKLNEEGISISAGVSTFHRQILEEKGFSCLGTLGNGDIALFIEWLIEEADKNLYQEKRFKKAGKKEGEKQ